MLKHFYTIWQTITKIWLSNSNIGSSQTICELWVWLWHFSCFSFLSFACLLEFNFFLFYSLWLLQFLLELFFFCNICCCTQMPQFLSHFQRKKILATYLWLRKLCFWRIKAFPRNESCLIEMLEKYSWVTKQYCISKLNIVISFRLWWRNFMVSAYSEANIKCIFQTFCIIRWN